MATYCALHIKADNVAPVLVCLEAFLTYQHRSPVVMEPTDARGGHLFGEDFINSECLLPTIFAVAATQPGWIAARYNSFNDLDALCRQLSDQADATVVACIAQSVAGAYRLAVYEDGRCRRILNHADGEWAANIGDPYPFESRPLGTNIAAEGEAPVYSFRRDDVVAYCRHLGLELWGSEQAESWVRLSVRRTDEKPPTGRPWWRLW
jgi:hypothetical protein